MSLAGAVLVNHLYRAGAAALLALPVVVTIAGSGIGNFAEGDAKLFEPGALYLLEVLLHERGALAAATLPVFVASLGFALASVLPESLLLVAVWRRAEARRAPLGVREALPRLFAVGVATWLARIALVIGTVVVAMTVRSYAAGAIDERWPLLLTSGVAALGLLAQAVVSVLRDVALLTVVGGGARTSAAVGFALATLRGQGIRLACGYAAAAAANVALLAGTLSAGAALDSALAALLLHQLAIAAGIALRAAWLCAARRAIEGEVGPRSGGSVLVDLQVTPGGGLPAQVEAQEPPGEPGPGGVPVGREPSRDRAE